MRSNSVPSLNAKKSSCKYGHPFDEKNTVFSTYKGRNRRKCKACKQRGNKIYQQVLRDKLKSKKSVTASPTYGT